MADKQKIAPEQAASTMQNFDGYWEKEGEKLEDMCRQQKKRQEREMRDAGDDPTEATGMPHCFFTIAPAEWKFCHHQGMLHWTKEAGFSESDAQQTMLLHMNHVIGTVLKEVVLKTGKVEDTDEFRERLATGIEEV